MSNQVIVTAHPETGHIVTPSSNPEWSRIRVESTALTVNNGIMQKQTRSALISLRTEDAKNIAPLLKAGEAYPVEGKIVVKEATKPFWEGQAPKINPQTDEVLVDANGNDIYRTTEFTTDLEAKDELVQHYTAQMAASEDMKAEGEDVLEDKDVVVSSETVDSLV